MCPLPAWRFPAHIPESCIRRVALPAGDLVCARLLKNGGRRCFGLQQGRFAQESFYVCRSRDESVPQCLLSQGLLPSGRQAAYGPFLPCVLAYNWKPSHVAFLFASHSVRNKSTSSKTRSFSSAAFLVRFSPPSYVSLLPAESPREGRGGEWGFCPRVPPSPNRSAGKRRLTVCFSVILRRRFPFIRHASSCSLHPSCSLGLQSGTVLLLCAYAVLVGPWRLAMSPCAGTV